MSRTRSLAMVCGFVVALHLTMTGAQTSDTRPLRLVVNFPPGGGTDVLGRAVAAKLESVLKRTVIVENRPGAGGAIGAEYVAQTARDGAHLLFGAVVPSPRLYVQPEGIANYAAVCVIARSPFLVAVHPGVPATSLGELVKLAKAKPGALNYGSPGNATPHHLATELFKLAAGIDVVHVPYKGGGPMVTDLLGGQIQLTFATVSSIEAHVASGRVRALAITGATRWDKMPSIPTVAESGYPGFQAEVGYGAFVSAGTPADIILGLNRALNEVLKAPEVAEKLTAQGYSAVGGTPEELATTMRKEVESIGALFKAGRVQMDK